jgi:hypothetical protein
VRVQDGVDPGYLPVLLGLVLLGHGTLTSFRDEVANPVCSVPERQLVRLAAM